MAAILILLSGAKLAHEQAAGTVAGQAAKAAAGQSANAVVRTGVSCELGGAGGDYFFLFFLPTDCARFWARFGAALLVAAFVLSAWSAAVSIIS